MTIILILTSNLFNRTTEFLRFGSRTVTAEQANSLAEAGIDKALWQLNKTAGSYVGENNTQLGSIGSFTVTIANKSSNLKTLTATGYVPNSASPISKKVIKLDVDIDSSIIDFNYAVQVGTGGISMSNNATVNGSVYSNKTGPSSISGSNGARITGDAFSVGNITSPNPTVGGTKHQNQQASQMPSVDYQSWEDDATSGGTTICSPTCLISSGTIGPRKYQGNINITNGSTVTLNGPIYVTGNVNVDNNGKVNLASSFGSNGTVFITDGTVNVSNNGGFNPNNSTPKGYILVVTTSTSPNAMTISNNGANAIFYALDGGASLSNNAQVTALVAASLTMGNNATLNYDSGLADASFTSGPGGSWQAIKGTYRYSP